MRRRLCSSRRRRAPRAARLMRCAHHHSLARVSSHLRARRGQRPRHAPSRPPYSIGAPDACGGSTCRGGQRSCCVGLCKVIDGASAMTTETKAPLDRRRRTMTQDACTSLIVGVHIARGVGALTVHIISHRTFQSTVLIVACSAALEAGLCASCGIWHISACATP